MTISIIKFADYLIIKIKMQANSKIYIAGHRGMVGSAMHRKLTKEGFTNIVVRTSTELDLTNQQAVADFFSKEKPEYVFLAAAKVGGIVANNTYRADFIYENLMIAASRRPERIKAIEKVMEQLMKQSVGVEPMIDDDFLRVWNVFHEFAVRKAQ